MSLPVTTDVSTLGDLLIRAAALQPDRLALAMPQARVTYAQLLDGTWRVARALHGLGVKRGEHVALLLPNCVEYAEALFGVTLAGCIAVPLNARHRAAELGFIIDNAKAVAVLTSRDPNDPIDFLAILADALPATENAEGVAAYRSAARRDRRRGRWDATTFLLAPKRCRSRRSTMRERA